LFLSLNRQIITIITFITIITYIFYQIKIKNQKSKLSSHNSYMSKRIKYEFLITVRDTNAESDLSIYERFKAVTTEFNRKCANSEIE
jgi:hypothetical protein